MKSAHVLALVLHLLEQFLGSEIVIASTTEIKLYQTMLQEYDTMMSQVHPYVLIGKTSCQNSCHKNAGNTRRLVDECHCDDHCLEFRDCCLDYWKSCNSSFLGEAFNHSQSFRCVEQTFKISNHSKTDHSISGTLGFQAISVCPGAFQDPKIRQKCENLNQNSPFVQGEDGRTYRNSDCAICHGIVNWNSWITSLACVNSTFELIQERLERKNYTFSDKERELIRNTCDVKMSPPREANAFHCRIVAECQDKTNPDYLKCLFYKQQLYSIFGYPTARNPHCVKCSGTFLALYSLINGQRTEPKNSLTILFDFSKASQIYGSGKIDIVQRQRCLHNEIFDFQHNSCRKQKIRSEIRNINWTCEFMNETFPNSSAYIHVFKNGSIYVPAHRETYKPMQYHWNGDNITVCGNFTKSFTKSSKRTSSSRLYSKTESYLTATGYILSIIALLVVLLTYSLFSELRTLPGIIVMNLAVAVLLSQVVFLVDTYERISGAFCKAIAVFLHFLYLASFCSMNVIAFDVAKTFTIKGRRSQRRTQKRAFVLSFLYAWGLPILLVSLTLGVDSSGAMDISYGNVYYCWITNPLALVIFFVVPVMIMLVFNVVALVLVLVLIRRDRKITKAIIDRSATGQDFNICWKLTAVFGLTWILGVVAPFHVALRIAFILCNSLQGFFIMVGFIMTRRILNMYLRMAGMRPLVTRTGPTRSTMNGSKRRRSISSAGKTWGRAKPTSKQHDVSTGMKEIATINKSVQMREIIGVKTAETDA